MAKRVITKIGDIFDVNLENGCKKYFQYIANDMKQLNSDVIRVFKKEYLINEVPNYEELCAMEVDFHAHTMINLGVRENLFHQTGIRGVVADIKNILFRDTNDYGQWIGGEPIRISEKWYVWHINDELFTCVGKLVGENRKAEIGVVINPHSIVHRIQAGKYDFFYPDFE